MSGDTAPVALLIPAYNAESHIADILDDAARQTLPFAEVIVYDDASSDRTAELAKSLGAKVIAGTVNCGAAYARNRLIDATSSEWVHFHDADDRLSPEFLQTMWPLAQSSATSVLCAQEVIRRLTGEHVSFVDHSAVEVDALAYFLRQVASYSSIGLYRVEKLRQVGGFDERLRGNEDPDIHVRLALVGEQFSWCGKVLSFNLLRSDSFSGSNWLRCMTDRLTCLEAYEARGLGERHLRELGAAALWTANQLWRRGELAAGRRSLRLARRCGITEVDSPHRFTRLASRLLGLEAVFHARTIKARLFSS